MWPSTAIDRTRATAAAPTCWRRSGIQIAIAPEEAARAIREIGIGFLFAPDVHTAMKHAQPVRAELKMRTVFNLLGPLTNPAGATAQLVGGPSAQAIELMAGALAALGLDRGFVVHGSDGLDEITTTGPTLAFEICHGAVTATHPAARRFRSAAGGGVGSEGWRAKSDNCAITRKILAASAARARDIVLVNASAALGGSGTRPKTS